MCANARLALFFRHPFLAPDGRRAGYAWGLCLLLLVLPPGIAAPADPLREKAVHIAYRIDHELATVDAAQRHALVARLLVALEGGELTPASELEELWFGWAARLEALENAVETEELPAWHQPFMTDAVGLLIQSVHSDQSRLLWTDGLWRQGNAWAGLRAVSSPASGALASSYYAGVLSWARSHAPDVWHRLLLALEAEPEWRLLIAPLIEPWLALPMDAPLAQWRALDDQASVALRQIFAATRHSAADLLADEVGLLFDEALLADRHNRPKLVQPDYLSFLHQPGDESARQLNSLARAVHRLDRGHYAALVSTLVSVAAGHLHQPIDAATLEQVLTELDRLDPLLPSLLARVDPRLVNVYQQTRRLLRSPVGGAGERQQRLQQLGALSSALSLDVSLLESYLEQPVRETLVSELGVCFGMSRAEGITPAEPISAEQYRGCLRSLATWATQRSRSAELAGRAEGPYASANLQREARLTPWQRINYWIGHVVQQTGAQCHLPETPLANPFEWAVATRAIRWFADRWPQYADAETLAVMDELAAVGLESLEAQVQLRLCADRERPLLGSISEYRGALADLAGAINRASLAFRDQHMRPGADIKLAGDATQETRYRPQDRKVGPCRGQHSCDMSAALEPSNALYSLFPETLLVADQIGIGELQLCYTDVAWVDRRSESPQVMSSAMASYYGRLSFVLRGTFSTLEEPVFAMQLVSPREYEYLFGANQPEVLADPCPRELVNTQVHAELPERAIQLVPRRLTYMTADRTRPARLFESNWASGEEWRDWFVTGRGVEELERQDVSEIDTLIDLRLDELEQQWNQTTYRQLLSRRPLQQNSAPDELALAMERLETQKLVLASLAPLIAPRPLELDPLLRASLYGEIGLFDRGTVLRLQQAGRPVDEVVGVAEQRFGRALQAWRSITTDSRAVALADAEPMISATMLELESVAARVRAALKIRPVSD